MRTLILLTAWCLSVLSIAHAQAPTTPLPADTLTGAYAVQTQRGVMVLRIHVSGGRVTGTLEVPGSNTIALSGEALGPYARGTILSGSETGEFEALLEGQTLSMRLWTRTETVPLRLQRVNPSAAAPSPGPYPSPTPSPGPAAQTGAGDPRLVGTWTGQTMISSGDASMTSEQVLIFHADGSYTYGQGRAVAGGSGWSFDGGQGGGTERGRWRTEGEILYLAGQSGQWQRIGRYGMTEDGQTMRITYDRGGRKLWSRR
jgi:hypothetical protein